MDHVTYLQETRDAALHCGAQYEKRNGEGSLNVTKTYLNVLTPRLSERDFAIIETVGRFKLATSDQLERLHFSTGSPVSRARGRQFVLKRLVEQSVLLRIGTRPVGGARGGSGSSHQSYPSRYLNPRPTR